MSLPLLYKISLSSEDKSLEQRQLNELSKYIIDFTIYTNQNENIQNNVEYFIDVLKQLYSKDLNLLLNKATNKNIVSNNPKNQTKVKIKDLEIEILLEVDKMMSHILCKIEDSVNNKIIWNGTLKKIRQVIIEKLTNSYNDNFKINYIDYKQALELLEEKIVYMVEYIMGSDDFSEELKSKCNVNLKKMTRKEKQIIVRYAAPHFIKNVKYELCVKYENELIFTHLEYPFFIKKEIEDFIKNT